MQEIPATRGARAKCILVRPSNGQMRHSIEVLNPWRTTGSGPRVRYFFAGHGWPACRNCRSKFRQGHGGRHAGIAGANSGKAMGADMPELQEQIPARPWRPTCRNCRSKFRQGHGGRHAGIAGANSGKSMDGPNAGPRMLPASANTPRIPAGRSADAPGIRKHSPHPCGSEMQEHYRQVRGWTEHRALLPFHFSRRERKALR